MSDALPSLLALVVLLVAGTAGAELGRMLAALRRTQEIEEGRRIAAFTLALVAWTGLSVWALSEVARTKSIEPLGPLVVFTLAAWGVAEFSRR
jgi:hypothetical protein